MHGKTSVITTTQGVFAGLPKQFTVNRYHSLAIERSTCPAGLEVTAWTDDGEITGVRHARCPSRACNSTPNPSSPEHGHAMPEELSGAGMTLVDLRSDTVTQPTAAMRAAMLVAPLGDDVFADDPSVNALQEKIAACWALRAALLCRPARKATCAPSSAIAEARRRIHRGPDAALLLLREAAARRCSAAQPQPLAHAADGSLPLADIEAAIKPDDAQFCPQVAGAGEHAGGSLIPVDYV